MSTIQVTLPDGSSRELESGNTALGLAESIGPRLAKAATGARINGEVRSLTTPLSDGDRVKWGQSPINWGARYIALKI